MTLDPTAPAFSPSSSSFSSGPLNSSTLLPDVAAPLSSSSSKRPKRLSPTPPRPLLCSFFRSSNGCLQGDSCRFVHEALGSVGPLEPGKHQRLKRERSAAAESQRDREHAIKRLDKRGLMSCKYWLQGFCHRSTSCLYAHAPVAPTVDALLASSAVISASSAGRATASRPAAATSAGDVDDDSGVDEETVDGEACAVCYEVPEFYGLMESCNHAFCLPCLQAWRARTDGDSRPAAKTCPICRARSAFVTPSSRFFAAGAEKTALVERYKDNMGKKQCKYFAQSLRDPSRPPACPFKNACFYSHAHPVAIGSTFVSPVPSLMSARRSRGDVNGGGDFGMSAQSAAMTVDALTSLLIGLLPSTELSSQTDPQAAQAHSSMSRAITIAEVFMRQAAELEADSTGSRERRGMRREMARALRAEAVLVLSRRLEAVNEGLADELPGLRGGDGTGADSG